MIPSSFIVLITTVLTKVSTNDSCEWLDQEIEYFHRLEHFRHDEPDPSGVQGPKMKDKEREYYLELPVSQELSVPLQGPEDPPLCKYGDSVNHECITCYCTDELVWTCEIVCFHEVTQRNSRFRDYWEYWI